MMYFGILIFLGAWSSQASSITVRNYPTKQRSASTEGIEYILRSTGKYIQLIPMKTLHEPSTDEEPPNPIPIKTLHELSTDEEPPNPESYNFFMRVDADEQPDQSVKEFERVTEPAELASSLNKAPKKYTSAAKQVNFRPLNRRDFFPINPIENTGRMSSLVFDKSENRDANTLEILKSRSERPNRRQVQASGSDDNDRVEYQMHGFRGPKTYKFGYDTGKGKDRQFRAEESDSEGQVKGHYGYINNNNGKTIIVKYTASPQGGFRIEKVQ